MIRFLLGRENSVNLDHVTHFDMPDDELDASEGTFVYLTTGEELHLQMGNGRQFSTFIRQSGSVQDNLDGAFARLGRYYISPGKVVSAERWPGENLKLTFVGKRTIELNADDTKRFLELAARSRSVLIEPPIGSANPPA